MHIKTAKNLLTVELIFLVLKHSCTHGDLLQEWQHIHALGPPECTIDVLLCVGCAAGMRDWLTSPSRECYRASRVLQNW